MAKRLTRVAEAVGNTAGSIEATTASAGTKVQNGLSGAADKIGSSRTADRIEKRTRPARKALAKKVAGAKQVAKRRAATATKQAGGAKKAATKKAGGAKKVATKKAGGAKKVAASRR
jgi:hypothetical protein